MGKKARKLARKSKFIFDEDNHDFYDYEQEMADLGPDIYSTVWGDDDAEKDSHVSARRKIERRRDMKKLYSQLDEWEEFGMDGVWQ